MKIRLSTFVIILLLGLHAEAVNYTVKQAGGGNYTTIQACATAMAAGDTCTVYAGTYNENVTLTNGAIGAYKTLQANPGDAVYVLSFTVNSHNKIVGFHIQNPASPNSARCVAIGNTATDVWIQNNAMTACQTVRASTSTGTPSYVYFQNNTISYLCSTSSSPNVCAGVIATGDHWLIEGNDFSHLSDVDTLGASYIIFRNNYLHDFVESDCITSSAGGNGSNCHIDLSQTEPGGIDVKYIVVEGNHGGNNQGGYDPLAGTHANGHGFLMQADACPAPTVSDPYPCAYYIVRYNAFVHVAGSAIQDDNATRNTNSMGFSNVKVYNNTWIDFNYYSPLYGVIDGYSHYSVNASDINNIFYFPWAAISLNPYADDSTTDATFTYRNNLAWCLGADTGTTCNLHGHIYNKGNFTDDPGNIKADPKLANYNGSDFSLSAASPAIGAGSYLTTVASGDSGSGVTLLVNDAAFFQDSFGLLGVKPDQVRVGTSTIAQIKSVNYSTNTLNLANSITRSPGDPVYLFSDSTGRIVLIGNVPDLGALPYGAQHAPAPPLGLTVSVS
jgi:hypothetical protein